MSFTRRFFLKSASVGVVGSVVAVSLRPEEVQLPPKVEPVSGPSVTFTVVGLVAGDRVLVAQADSTGEGVDLDKIYLNVLAEGPVVKAQVPVAEEPRDVIIRVRRAGKNPIKPFEAWCMGHTDKDVTVQAIRISDL